ncbi:type I restriction enzyme S subunit [Cryobacterium mesophilum]|nr:type I restriction enzyme S subunit [Terrimesophilobacter mesophilus]
MPLAAVLTSLESGTRPPGGAGEELDGVPSIGGEHLSSDGTFNFDRRKTVPQNFFDSMKSGKIQPQDILVVKDGATTGKTSYVGFDFPYAESAVNEHVFRVEVDRSRADPSFVFRFLHSPQGQRSILRDFRGATVGGIGRGFIDVVRVPLPPLPEQRRIASILDQADTLRAKRRLALTHLHQLVSAEFNELFGDPSSGPAKYDRLPLGEIGRVITGNTPPRDDVENYGNSIEWVKSDNLGGEAAVVAAASEWLSAKGRVRARVVGRDAILVTCIAGSPNSIGNAAMADRDVAFNQQINALVPSQQHDPWFLLGQFRAAKALVQRASTGGMKGLVSKSRFEAIEFIVPPLGLQQKFGRSFQEIEKLKNAHYVHLTKLDELFVSLQHRAFAGEL